MLTRYEFCLAYRIQRMITANIEYRIMNVEYRRNEFCLFIKRLSNVKPPFDIRYSKFCGSAVRCYISSEPQDSGTRNQQEPIEKIFEHN